MNVTPAERRGFVAKTTSCTLLAWLLLSTRSSSSLLLLLLLLFSRSVFPFFLPPAPGCLLDRGTLDARGRSSMQRSRIRPCLVSSFHVTRSSSAATSTAAYLPLHVATSLQSRVFSRRATENGWFNQPDNLHAQRAEKNLLSLPSLSQPGVASRYQPFGIRETNPRIFG